MGATGWRPKHYPGLDNILRGDATKKIKIMVQDVFQACLDNFGVKEGKKVKPPAPVGQH